MSVVGLFISAAGSNDDSAYSHRLRELAKGLQRCSISCDFFFMPDHQRLRRVTTSCLFFPLWLQTLRRYDFIHCGDEEATQAMLLCRPFLPGVIVYDMHGDVVAQAALRNDTNPCARHRLGLLRVRVFERMARTAANHALSYVPRHWTRWIVHFSEWGHWRGVFRNAPSLFGRLRPEG